MYKAPQFSEGLSPTTEISCTVPPLFCSRCSRCVALYRFSFLQTVSFLSPVSFSTLCLVFLSYLFVSLWQLVYFSEFSSLLFSLDLYLVLFFALPFYSSFPLLHCSRSFLKFLLPLYYLCLSLSSLFLSLSSGHFCVDVWSLFVFPLILTSFIRSISYVIPSFLAFCLGCVRLPQFNEGPRQWDAFRSRCRREKILQREPLPW